MGTIMRTITSMSRRDLRDPEAIDMTAIATIASSANPSSNAASGYELRSVERSSTDNSFPWLKIEVVGHEIETNEVRARRNGGSLALLRKGAVQIRILGVVLGLEMGMNMLVAEIVGMESPRARRETRKAPSWIKALLSAVSAKIGIGGMLLMSTSPLPRRRTSTSSADI